MLKAGIIGAGGFGAATARRLSQTDDVSLRAICDIRAEVAEKAAKEFGAKPYFAYSDMFQEGLDMVFVCTTNAFHAECVIAAAEAGVANIYCEKPLALTMQEADDIVEAVEKKNIRTSMGFGGRLRDPYPYLNKLVGSGNLGEVMSCQTQTFRGYGFSGRELPGEAHYAVEHPEISGGWTVHHACHSVFWLMMIGGEVKEVYGRLLKSNADVKSEELVWATLTFRNGGVGVFSDSIGSFRGRRSCIIGTQGTLWMIDEHDRNPESDIEIRIHYEGKQKDERMIFHRSPGEPEPIIDFVTAVRENRPSPVSFRQGRENLRVCLAVKKSAGIGKVVEL